MNRLPSFVLLRAFEAAARLQSFTLAAAELHLTQSAISHQVKELEEHFGRKLFERRNRRIELTPEARRLQEALGRAFEIMGAACAEVSRTQRAEVLVVHCAPSFAARWLGPRLPAFMQEHPDITLRLSSGPEPLDLAQRQEVDVAISYAYALQRPGVSNLALGTERIVPLCSPSLVPSGTTPEGPAIRALIATLTLIDSQLSRVTWPDWFALNGMTLPTLARPSFDRAALALSAAVDGVGVALESARLAERELAKGELIELGGDTFTPLAMATHFFSYRIGEKNLHKVKTFRQWLWANIGLEDVQTER